MTVSEAGRLALFGPMWQIYLERSRSRASHHCICMWGSLSATYQRSVVYISGIPVISYIKTGRHGTLTLHV